MKNKYIDAIDREYEPLKSKHPKFNAGDTLNVSLKIKEGTKERIQQFKGIVLQKRNSGVDETFTIRKISRGIGVEKIIPLCSPSIEKIELLREGKVRRARLFYLRERKGKAYKTKNKIVVTDSKKKITEKKSVKKEVEN